MADTVIKEDGTVRHKCHTCDQWFDRDDGVVDDDPDDPDYLRCPDCRGGDDA